jgi:hypothetical protein
MSVIEKVMGGCERPRDDALISGCAGTLCTSSIHAWDRLTHRLLGSEGVDV